MNLEFSKNRLARRLARARSPIRWRTSAHGQEAAREGLWPRPKAETAVGGKE